MKKLRRKVKKKFWVLLWVPRNQKAPIYGALRGVFVPLNGLKSNPFMEDLRRICKILNFI